MDLPYIPGEVQGVMFGMFPPKEFIKICTLNIQHAENCKKAWYWKAYLADKDLEDWRYILDFLLRQGYEDNYKLFSEVFGEFTKKYKVDIEKGTKSINGRKVLKVISILKRFTPYFKHYDRDIHGLVSDMTPNSKYYKEYKKLYDNIFGNIYPKDPDEFDESNHPKDSAEYEEIVVKKFDDFRLRLVSYIKFDTIGMDDIMELSNQLPGEVEETLWIERNSKTAEDVLMAVTYFEKAGWLKAATTIKGVINYVGDNLLENIEEYVNKHGKFGPYKLNEIVLLLNEHKKMKLQRKA